MPGPSSVIARREFTSLSRKPMANRACRSTRRIASTGRRATSRTRPRTSTGSPPKAAEAPITRTCRLLVGAGLAALILAPVPAIAKLKAPPNRAYVYLEARAAAIGGDHARSAQLLSSLAEAEPANEDLNRRALSEAIGAGDMELAVRLARAMPPGKLSSDAR